jgi:hypothetical protein
MKIFLAVLLQGFFLISPTAYAGPWGALQYYHRIMNPRNCPTWLLAEAGEPYHSNAELEHYAFDHYLDDLNSGRVTYVEGCIDRFAQFPSTENRPKSPSFFLIWLRQKLPYERDIKVASYVHEAESEESPSVSFYTLIGKKTQCKISEIHNDKYPGIFPRFELYEVSGRHIGNEFFREVDEGKVNPILENFFIGKKSFMEHCVFRK